MSDQPGTLRAGADRLQSAGEHLSLNHRHRRIATTIEVVERGVIPIPTHQIETISTAPPNATREITRVVQSNALSQRIETVCDDNRRTVRVEAVVLNQAATIGARSRHGERRVNLGDDAQNQYINATCHPYTNRLSGDDARDPHMLSRETAQRGNPPLRQGRNDRSRATHRSGQSSTIVQVVMK